MTSPLRPSALLSLVAVFLMAALARGQQPLETPYWGHPMTQPKASNAAFATADGCAGCHSSDSDALAMRDITGGDISPHALWKATMMANAFRDPYWRSQVSREITASPKAAKEIQGLCNRCHAPMSHHSARLAGLELGSVRELAKTDLAVDGVSCTVCHQIGPKTLGEVASFSGNPDIGLDRILYGPYPDPFFQPMRMHSAFTATEGAHIQESALCGSCHTLLTKPAPDAPDFPEQTPYLEWRNSVYSTEGERSDQSKSCQDCHMRDLGTQTIARSPAGGDFNLEDRPHYRSHLTVGGNAFMLEIFRDASKELGVQADRASMDRVIAATRQQLTRSTARVSIEGLERKGDRLRFRVKVQNLTGHKLPTGYPSRRLWLRTSASVGDSMIFESGGVDLKGRLVDVKDERRLPHVDVVTKASDVPVWEAIPVDLAGEPTTMLHKMARYGKDNRILPRGWKKGGPETKLTHAIGTERDRNFIGGSDTVLFDLPIPDGVDGELWASVDVLYQTIPPSWAQPHRGSKTEESKRFVRLYDASNTLAEVICSAEELK